MADAFEDTAGSAGAEKEAAIGALLERAIQEISNEENVVRKFRSELQRACGAGAAAAEIFDALASMGYRLEREKFESALRAVGTGKDEPKERKSPPTEPAEPVSGYAPGYGSGQF